MKNLILIDHPLVKRDLTLLRDKRTPSHLFRSILRRTASLMAYEVTHDLKITKVSVVTPLEKTKGYVVTDSIILVPILRAGLGLVGGFVEVLPNARVGHIGMYRDEETLKPVDYYLKFPKQLKKGLVLVLDPMLATGGSAAAAVSVLKKKGAKKIRFISLVAAPEGVRLLARTHPDILIFTCALDRQLNDKGYILPGLGDAGDRIFGTAE
ncbi:MAG: uracil phosphoribosyltransferase [Ignavibacteria bacterium]|nr:uracil phosphoribosyltransferase [Ignavibacteria bacterium]MBI3766620.1 uracil phosphoribosyltransferase [Ignavibacteriales bacterium]